MRFLVLGLLLAIGCLVTSVTASAQCVGGNCFAPAPVASGIPSYPQTIQGYRVVPQQYQLQGVQMQPIQRHWFPGRGIGRFFVGGWRTIRTPVQPRYQPVPRYVPAPTQQLQPQQGQ